MKNIELICEAVHKAYCKERIRQRKEPYWTGGDYAKLDEKTKDYDRATVRAVQEFMDNLEEQQAKRIIELEAGINSALYQLHFFRRNSHNIGSWSFKESLKKTIKEVEQALKEKP